MLKRKIWWKFTVEAHRDSLWLCRLKRIKTVKLELQLKATYARVSKSASHRNDLSPVITIGLRIDVEAHLTRHGESRPGHCATDQYRFVISILAFWDLSGFERNRSTLRFNLLSRFQKIEIDRSTKRRKGDCGHLRDFITTDIKLLFCVTANNERKKASNVCRKASRTNTSEHANMHDG